MSSDEPRPAALAAALRAPVVPELFGRLTATPYYLAHVWPVLEASIETAGFLGSALYLADMALDAVEEVYEPVVTRETLGATLPAEDLDAVESTLDVFHYLQPQVLLAGAALAEAFERPAVGGSGRAERREPRPREQAHLQAVLPEPVVDAPLLAEIAETLQLPGAPQLYGILAHWPSYLDASWDELQHLAAYPDFRRRGRALYYYARSGARFLAEPLRADATALREAGVSDDEVEAARSIVDASVPALATMVMHCTAMRLALGHVEREVVGSS
jgi:hypothetical protein